MNYLKRGVLQVGDRDTMAVTAIYDSVVKTASSKVIEALVLLFLRVAVAGIFWRSGRTKIEEGSALQISDTAYFLFENEYAGVPLPSEFAAIAATAAEHVFPILLIVGLATRVSALALLGMTMVIQLFVYPEAWWTTHRLWAAMLLVLIVRGAGMFSIDHLLAKGRSE
ncbi:DoxX family protein [Sphingomonas sp. AX6]|uniref:DoxX family protein n=1 Tax=Sphingomonas sp. AX6 TaxID=2653171 RepID=UPI002E2DE5D8|nr:DoxX family protein [Sphingomonas sp. AX6]